MTLAAKDIKPEPAPHKPSYAVKEEAKPEPPKRSVAIADNKPQGVSIDNAKAMVSYVDWAVVSAAILFLILMIRMYLNRVLGGTDDRRFP